MFVKLLDLDNGKYSNSLWFERLLRDSVINANRVFSYPAEYGHNSSKVVPEGDFIYIGSSGESVIILLFQETFFLWLTIYGYAILVVTISLLFLYDITSFLDFCSEK